jgi:TRAP-type mannitol/chloroaromatic compound transport system substrate-binding protein
MIIFNFPQCFEYAGASVNEKTCNYYYAHKNKNVSFAVQIPIGFDFTKNTTYLVRESDEIKAETSLTEFFSKYDTDEE